MALFHSHHKFKVHLVQVLLAVVIIALSVARMLLSGQQTRTRASTMGIGMGAKSLVIILYQLLTEHVSRLQRWASLKAYLILNSLEIVFWGAVVFLVLQANLQVCVGTGCALGWVVIVLSANMNLLSVYTTVVSYLDYRYYKAKGQHRGSTVKEELPLHSRSESDSSV
ncbi:hypothetical protein PENSOL_c008G10525 [Penicillium solitum]|uniref:Uncharacterized protein n=1 Tax=Penicillium solitum TaxID=60172 RepID=A0A1V6RBK5_9EURO|nr:uncharacterized protein PENSOL_c008G10525 [Penicillium solitum]OQD98925.1 hypothetical protein PENSOL_c008G10525 [Penicillium solitum]